MNKSIENLHLWAKVAKLYYEDDFTQGEIAKKLGFSRIKIHRILQAAKEAGIVQVIIKSPAAGTLDLENRLLLKYNLRDCVVVESYPPGDNFYLSLSRGVSSWLKQHLKQGIRVGLGICRTLTYLPQAFEMDREIDCTFTEIAGAVSDNYWGFKVNNIASKMAEMTGARAEVFYAPTIVSSPELKKELIKEESVRISLERARNCDIVIQSVGPVDESALLFIQGILSREDLEQLKANGAVGDALGCYYDRGGRIVPSPTEDRMIGVHLSEMSKVPWSVLIGGGPEKVIPINAALIGKYFNVLVTDRQTAESLLELDPKSAAQ